VVSQGLRTLLLCSGGQFFASFSVPAAGGLTKTPYSICPLSIYVCLGLWLHAMSLLGPTMEVSYVGPHRVSPRLAVKVYDLRGPFCPLDIVFAFCFLDVFFLLCDGPALEYPSGSSLSPCARSWPALLVPRKSTLSFLLRQEQIGYVTGPPRD